MESPAPARCAAHVRARRPSPGGQRRSATGARHRPASRDGAADGAREERKKARRCCGGSVTESKCCRQQTEEGNLRHGRRRTAPRVVFASMGGGATRCAVDGEPHCLPLAAGCTPCAPTTSSCMIPCVRSPSSPFQVICCLSCLWLIPLNMLGLAERLEPALRSCTQDLHIYLDVYWLLICAHKVLDELFMWLHR